MAEWPKADAFLAARGIRFGAPTLGQTTGGIHADGSEHYEARARDYGDANSDCPAILNAFAPYATGANYQVDELFYKTTFISNGKPFTPSADLRAAHQNHVHVGLIYGANLPAVGSDYVPTPGVGTSTNDGAGISSFFSTVSDHQNIARAVKVAAGLVIVVTGIGMVLQ